MKSVKNESLLAACIIFGLSSEAFAVPLTLRDAVRTGLAKNPEVAAADLDVSALKSKGDQVRAHHWPQISLDAGYARLEEVPVMKIPAVSTGLPAALPLPVGPGGALVKVPLPQTIKMPDIPFARKDITGATLGIQLPIYTGGRVEYGIDQVNHGVSALQARADSKRNEVAYSIVKAYLGAVLAQRAAEVTERAYLTVKQHETQAEKAVKAGMIPKYELIRARTEVANQDRRRLDANNQAALALAFLQDTLGDPEGQTPTLVTPLKSGKDVSVELEPSIQEALKASSDMKALADRDLAFIDAEKAARAELMPTVALVGSQELYSKGLFDKDLPLSSPEGFIGVAAHLPLFDGGMARAKLAEQEALRARNGSDVQRLKNGIRLEVRKYSLDLAAGRKALAAADQAIELAEENLRLATSRFEAGEGTGLEKMDAVLTLSIAETNREQARYQYDLAYYGLKKATGAIRAEF